MIFFVMALFPYCTYGDDGVLADSAWELLFTADSVENGLIQSICVTDDYIITIENAGDDPNRADIVSAYYKNDTDAYGNPVGRYTLANRVQMEEWEHGNGMCWNPNTDEIYVALYTNTIPENRGCLYVMDPYTLTKKGIIKVAEDFNILAIAYEKEQDRYFIQTNADANYRIMLMNALFQITEDLGEESADPGYNFQDFTLEGEHLLQFPLTWNMGIGEYMMAYSIREHDVVDTIQLFFDELPDEKYIEPESIARLDDESFIVPVNATAHDDSRRCLFYRVKLPHILSAQETQESAPAVITETPTPVPTQSPEVSVTKGSQELSRTESGSAPEKKFPVGIVILLIVLAAAAAVFFGYVQHIRKERAKREARMRKKRRALLAKIEREKKMEGINTDIDYTDDELWM